MAYRVTIRRALLLCALAPALLATSTAAPPPEDSIFVYDVFAAAPACPVIEQRLARLPLRPTVLLSVEQGPEFLLDSPAGAARLRCALSWLRRHGHRTKAMLLQDVGFMDRQSEAVRRIARLANFAHVHADIRAAVLDLEPYAHPHWECASAEDRRQLALRFVDLLRAVRQASRSLPLEMAAPWWLPAMQEIPEMQPASLFQIVSGMYLMLYGDPGGPLVAPTAQSVLERVPPAGAFFSHGGRVYLGVATYEIASRAAMEGELTTLRRRYARAPGFAGTVVFHAASPYAAPLVRMVAGQVVDAQGKGVAGAEIEFAGMRARTSDCGNFSFRGFTAAEGEMTVRHPGFRAASLSVQVSPPGRETSAGVIHLTPDG
jgi:hypothetical protein